MSFELKNWKGQIIFYPLENVWEKYVSAMWHGTNHCLCQCNIVLIQFILLNWDAFCVLNLMLGCPLLSYCFGIFFLEFLTSWDLWLTATGVLVVYCSFSFKICCKKIELDLLHMSKLVAQCVQYFLHIPATMIHLSACWMKDDKMAILITQWYQWCCNSS